MSKIENTGNHKDIYSVWKDGLDHFYSNIEKSIPQFHQAATNLFQEYVKAWNNASSSIVDIQREFATKAGIKSNLPEASINIMRDSAEKINRSFDVQNKISIASIDAAKQNIHTWNENSSAFANINKSIADSLILPFNPKI
ncbi:MAG: hypothetical protein OEL81_04180 [Nitrosopumilus sp.]|nr:hypothetical protein [Nitrosopumilus sp.]MDH3488710.1 hypothetical protein [Nitrosopumilus sp.]